MEKDSQGRLTAREGRKFAWTLAGALLVLALIALWRDRATLSQSLFVIAGLFALSGLLIPTRLGPVERAWMRLGKMLSAVTTPIFLGIVYFLIFTPVGLIRRAFGKNSVARDPNAPNYWVVRDSVDVEQARRSMERQF